MNTPAADTSAPMSIPYDWLQPGAVVECTPQNMNCLLMWARSLLATNAELQRSISESATEAHDHYQQQIEQGIRELNAATQYAVELHRAARVYMDTCPADADTTGEFWNAGQALKAALAKHPAIPEAELLEDCGLTMAADALRGPVEQLTGARSATAGPGGSPCYAKGAGLCELSECLIGRRCIATPTTPSSGVVR